MEATPVPRVKVCCIQSVAEARVAVAAGAAALGLVSEMPSGPGVIPEARIAAIAAAVPPPVAHAELRAELPGIRLVQVIHVTGPEAVDEAQEVAPRVDAVLLDSGNPDLPVKQLGGTGRRHDWALSRRIREAIEVPVFLAGGLTADNAAEAIAAVGPFALDVCGGVRTAGALDEARLRAFFRAVASASGQCRSN